MSAKNRPIQARPARSSDVIQTDAPIPAGAAGGPLVDAPGDVIGLIRAIIANAQSIGLRPGHRRGRAARSPRSSRVTPTTRPTSPTLGVHHRGRGRAVAGGRGPVRGRRPRTGRWWCTSVDTRRRRPAPDWQVGDVITAIDAQPVNDGRRRDRGGGRPLRPGTDPGHLRAAGPDPQRHGDPAGPRRHRELTPLGGDRRVGREYAQRSPSRASCDVRHRTQRRRAEPPRGHVKVVYLGPVAPHWEVRSDFGDHQVINDFRSRVESRLLLLPPHDPQFRRNRERVVRDAERENLLLDWDLGIPEDDAMAATR